jgi:hypothetical protein
MYRQFNGGNYNVSVTQVMETEKKLRIKSVLGIKSARYGMVPLDVSNLEVSNDEPDKDTQFSIEYIQRLYESDMLHLNCKLKLLAKIVLNYYWELNLTAHMCKLSTEAV